MEDIWMHAKHTQQSWLIQNIKQKPPFKNGLPLIKPFVQGTQSWGHDEIHKELNEDTIYFIILEKYVMNSYIPEVLFLK